MCFRALTYVTNANFASPPFKFASDTYVNFEGRQKMPKSDTQDLKTNQHYKNKVHGLNGKKKVTMICENTLWVKGATKRFIQ